MRMVRRVGVYIFPCQLVLVLVVQQYKLTRCSRSCFSRTGANNAGTYMDESTQIFNTIFHKYEPNVPPRKNFPNPLYLNVRLHVRHVSNLNLVEQHLESTVDLEIVSTCYNVTLSNRYINNYDEMNKLLY